MRQPTAPCVGSAAPHLLHSRTRLRAVENEHAESGFDGSDKEPKRGVRSKKSRKRGSGSGMGVRSNIPTYLPAPANVIRQVSLVMLDC